MLIVDRHMTPEMLYVPRNFIFHFRLQRFFKWNRIFYLLKRLLCIVFNLKCFTMLKIYFILNYLKMKVVESFILEIYICVHIHIYIHMSNYEIVFLC